MNPVLVPILTALLFFQTKHFICDFLLQSNWQFRNKGTYGHPGGLLHAGLHVVASIPALLVLTQSAVLIAALCAAEFVIHYHCDWSKSRIDARLGLSTEDWGYWVIFGIDQFVHQLTYLGMIYLLEI